MHYTLLLRGINVGGKNKVVMADLKADLAGLGFENPISYINSGNPFCPAQLCYSLRRSGKTACLVAG